MFRHGRGTVLIASVALAFACTSMNWKLPEQGMGQESEAARRTALTDRHVRVEYSVDCGLCTVRFTVGDGRMKEVDQVVGAWSERATVPATVGTVAIGIGPLDGKKLWSAEVRVDGVRLESAAWPEGHVEAVSLVAPIPAQGDG